MANTTIQLKKSTVPGNVPSDLASGELAINTADGVLFYKDPSNVIRTFQSGSSTNSYSTLNVNSSLFLATSNASILTIDSSGAITLATDSINDKFTIGVRSASNTVSGVVQLYDGLDSTSISLAATASSVNTVYDFAKSAYDAANNVVSGSIDTWSRDRANSAYNEANSKIDLLTEADFLSNSVSTTSNTSNQILDYFSSSLYRSVKYIIQVTSSTDYQVSELLLIHNGTNSYITEYGLITTNGVLANYDSDINSGNVRLLISPINNINSIKVIKTLISL